MKKLTAILALVLALCMFTACSFAEPGTEKYAEPVEVHFVRDTDDTLDANFFSQFPDKTMEDNLWCDLYRDQLNIIVKYDWIVKSGTSHVDPSGQECPAEFIRIKTDYCFSQVSNY